MALLSRLFDAASWPKESTIRLAGMVGIIAKHRTDSGSLPIVGDDDSGRVIAIDHGSRTSRVDALLKLADQTGIEKISPASGLLPFSGWWTERLGPWFVHGEFGGVGFHGKGAHAHDDDLSLWLEYQGIPIFVDPGAYLYTPDRDARDLFRSARYHTTVRLLPPGAMPQPLHGESTFEWHGRLAPLQVQLTRNEGEVTCRITDGAVHRQIALCHDFVEIKDRLCGSGEGWWFFHLHPGVQATVQENGILLKTGTIQLSLTLDPPLSLTLEPAGFSPNYGTKNPSTILIAHTPVKGEFHLAWKVKPIC
jgi:hypothetical protein